MGRQVEVSPPHGLNLNRNLLVEFRTVEQIVDGREILTIGESRFREQGSRLCGVKPRSFGRGVARDSRRNQMVGDGFAGLGDSLDDAILIDRLGQGLADARIVKRGTGGDGRPNRASGGQAPDTLVGAGFRLP